MTFAINCANVTDPRDLLLVVGFAPYQNPLGTLWDSRRELNRETEWTIIRNCTQLFALGLPGANALIPVWLRVLPCACLCCMRGMRTLTSFDTDACPIRRTSFVPSRDCCRATPGTRFYLILAPCHSQARLPPILLLRQHCVERVSLFSSRGCLTRTMHRTTGRVNSFQIFSLQSKTALARRHPRPGLPCARGVHIAFCSSTSSPFCFGRSPPIRTALCELLAFTGRVSAACRQRNM